MCKHIRLILSFNDEDNKAVLKAVEKLRTSMGVTVEIMNGVAVLNQYVELPYISTDEGTRVFGVKSINRFIGKQLSPVTPKLVPSRGEKVR